MDLEILDRLEDKVDACVGTVRDLRAENDELRRETASLESKVADLLRDTEQGRTARGEAESLRKRCGELEQKLERIRSRVEAIIGKIKTLEG